MLTAALGSWSGTQPISYAYQWQRCDQTGGGCSNIAGATGATYPVVTGDVGSTIVVNVTASNGGGNASKASAATGVVQAASAVAPVNSVAPSISGTAQDGQVLTAALGSWSGTQPISYAYQWQRCDQTGGGCSNIAGATGATYPVVTGDVGSTIVVNVTASNGGGNASKASAATGVVQAASAVAPVNSVAPSISGTAQDGQVLTAALGSWSGTQPISYAYQWQRCDQTGGGCSNIAGATGATYPVVTGDVGSTIVVNVTASNGGGNASKASAATGVVQAASAVAPVNSVAPSISGTAQDGQVLTAALGSWSGTQPISYAYQWQRCDQTGGGCSNIAGATGATYPVVTGDVGSTIVVNVTASNGGGNASKASAATGVVQAASAVAPVNSVAPSISGTAQDGQVLTAALGSWSGTQPISYAYQWQRCDQTGGGCSNIAGATGRRIRL